jgi:glycosyltransferase involved in cell wall biosynthesis
VDFFNGMVNHCYAKMINMPAEMHRPAMSIFTTCYKSYEKILRAYESIKKQVYLDWEWVVMDDSPEDEHILFLRKLFQDDKRIRLYKRSENSGNIGNVKNEVVGLCRGKYVLEMDHDDEILPDLIQDAVAIFEKDPDVGFVYSDFINLYEDGRNFRYSDFFGLG